MTQKPLKIAVIGHKRIPSREGGLEKTVEEQTRRLLRRYGEEFEFVLYNRGGHNVFGEQYDRTAVKQYHGMRVVTMPAFRGSAEVPLYSLFATLHAVFTGCEVIYYHASGPCVMIRLAKLFGKKTVAMLHGIDSERDKWSGFAAWYLRQGERTAARLADVCLVLSDHMQEELRQAYGRTPDIIHNGMTVRDSEDRDSEDRETLGRFGLLEEGYFLTVVRIVPEKGLHYLIPAFRKLTTDKKLVIAGGAEKRCEPYLNRLKALAGDDPRIVFTGFLGGRELQVLYRHAYAFVLASTLEGMANALLEAMAAGLCCLVSDIPENREVAGRTGACFHSRDVKSLRQALQQLLEDPEGVRRKGEAARELVRERYSWDRCVEQLAEIFRGLGADKKPGGSKEL